MEYILYNTFIFDISPQKHIIVKIVLNHGIDWIIQTAIIYYIIKQQTQEA